MNKFFLKDFFQNYRSKKRSIEVSWNNPIKNKVKYEENIKKNIEKMGAFENRLTLKLKSQKEIYNEYQIHWEKHKTIRHISNKELKNLFYILFSNPNEGVEQGLYENPDQFNDFLSVLEQKNKQWHLKKLISELLYHYPEPYSILFNRLNKIYKFLDKKKLSNKSLVTVNSNFRLLEQDGPFVIAKKILNIENSLNALLQDLWIKEKHLHNGIGGKIVEELCQLIRKPLKRLAEEGFHQTDQRVLKRFLEYLSGDKKSYIIQSVSKIYAPCSESKRYSDIKPIVRALLNPFKDKKPEKSIQTTITQFLDQNIGDPRFSSEKWIALQKEKYIFLRWKTGETIKDFLELLDYTAKKNPDADRMWPYRKEFIESYLESNHIKEAWIILGDEAYKNRSKFLNEKSNEYGRIFKGNSLHSALIYKIGSLIISEWNYNGKARIWNGGNQNAPAFYKKKYLRKDLRNNPDKEIIHHFSEKYSWQKKLSGYIYEYTGISPPEDLQAKMYQF